MMKKILDYPLVLLFAAFFFLFSVTDLFFNAREFSVNENRYLQLRPEFSVKTLMNGKYTTTFETYINDQFVFRDGWIDIKSKAEYFIGKQENNSIIYGKGGYMFEKYDRTDDAQIAKNTAAVGEFFAKYNSIPATFAIIPNSYMILGDKLPFGVQLLNQFAYIDQIYGQITAPQVSKLSLEDSLLEHKNNYIYYMTDHHWTTYGAYLAYSDFVRSKGMQPVPYESLSGTEVPGFYGTYFAKTKFFKTQPDIVTYFDVPDSDVSINGKKTVEDSQKNTIPVEGLYHLSQFEQRDKYAAFLYGNHGVTVIQSDGNLNHTPGKTSRILVIKDSYGNSFVPFLTYNYDEVVVVDLRAIPFEMSKFMAENEFDDILLLYNFMNYASDVNFARLKY